MKAVNVRQLKNNPSEALRSAVREPVLVLKGDQPEALLVHVDFEGIPEAPEVKLLLASALFKSGALSLGRAARLAGIPVSEIVTHLSRLGIAAVDGDRAEVVSDLETLDEWLASS